MITVGIDNIVIDDIQIEEFGEYILNDEGLIKEQTEGGSIKLSSIQKSVFEEDGAAANLMNNFSLELFDAILNNNFEFGVESGADKLFNIYHEKYGVLAVNWLMKLFITNLFHLNIILGILLLLSRQKLSDIGYQGQMMLISATYKFNNDLQIQEAIIRCIENWESFELIHILDELHPNEKWLNDYKLAVIEDLKLECHTL